MVPTVSVVHSQEATPVIVQEGLLDSSVKKVWQHLSVHYSQTKCKMLSLINDSAPVYSVSKKSHPQNFLQYFHVWWTYVIENFLDCYPIIFCHFCLFIWIFV